MKTQPIQWAWQKAALLFLGLIAKGIADRDPLPFGWGVGLKAICGVLWFAFEGAFLWLLTPPSQQPKAEPIQGEEKEETP